MTLEELEKMCALVLSEGGEHITLVLPKGVSSRIRGFPRGKLLCEHHDGSRVFRYDARRVLKSIEAARAD